MSDSNKSTTVDEACWKGYHKEGNKKMFGRIYPNCIKNKNVSHLETEQTSPNPNRHGHAINVATEAVSPAQQAAIAISKKEHSPVKKLLEQKFKNNLKEINIRNADGDLKHVNKVPIRMADGKIKLMDPGKSGSSGGGK